MHLEQSIAYALLTFACCSGIVAAYQLLELEEYFYLPGLLLGTLAANVSRRLLAPITTMNPVTLAADRVLFFVWPFGVLVLLCIAFEQKRLLRAIAVPAALLVGAIVAVPALFNEHVLHAIGQGIACFTGILALVLIALRGKRAAFLVPLEMGAFFAGVSEGLIALVGYLVPGTWWPAVVVYCALYLALILLHLRVLWTLRRTQTSSLDSQTT